MASLLNGNPMPLLIYGTARRDGKRLPDVSGALEKGYRAIDTASSRRFHFEMDDGKALSEYLGSSAGAGSVSREDVWVQSRCSLWTEKAADIQPDDEEIAAGDLTSRVYMSVLCSTVNLRVEVLDAYLLDAPGGSAGAALEAWRALELVADQGGVRYLGVANVVLPRLQLLWEQARHRPVLVQNWFRRGTAGYGGDVVAFCRDRGIAYQIFGVFDRANTPLLACAPVTCWARTQAISAHQALLRLLFASAAARGLQLAILDGSTAVGHMDENLEAVRQLGDSRDPDVERFSKLIGWN